MVTDSNVEWQDLPTGVCDDWNDEEFKVLGRNKPIFNEEGGPWATYVELNPETVLEAHSNTQPQFQVFLDGSGSMDGTEIRPVTYQYTAL